MDPDDLETIVDLTERMRDLGVAEFTVSVADKDSLRVKFREGTVVPAEAQRGGKSPGEHAPTPRDLRSTAKAQGIGPLAFPGNEE